MSSRRASPDYGVQTPLLILSLVLALVGFGIPADAGIVTFTNSDNGVAAGGARPNSDAAASSFDAAVGAHTTITFEGLPVGNFAALGVAPGGTATLTNTAADVCAGICNQNDTVLGYNTTSAGLQHLRVVPQFGGPNVSVTFAFASPINFWGAYLTGTQSTLDGTITLNFNDGSNQSLAVPKTDNSGGVEFFGFTDFGPSISSVSFTEEGPFNTRDIWGIDDVRFGAVPEPSTLLLLGSGLVGIGGIAWRRRHRV